MTRKLFSVLIIAALAGCGGGLKLGDPEAPTSTQQQANTQLGSSTSDLTALKGGSQDKVWSLQAMMSGIGATGTKIKASTKGVGFPLRGDGPLAPQSDPSCVTGDGTTGWTYNHCEDDGTSIDGSVKLSGDTVTIDLSISSSSQGSVKITLKGSITVTETSLDGSLRYDVTASYAGYTGGSIHTKVDYNQVTFAEGCVTGGSITIDYSAAGVSGLAEYEYTGCNQLTVRNGS